MIAHVHVHTFLDHACTYMHVPTCAYIHAGKSTHVSIRS